MIPILPAPFTSRGSIDHEGFARVVDASIASGANAVALFGLVSEFYKLSESERDDLTKLLVRSVGHRCPVIISVVHHSTQLAISEALRAEQDGADALMLLPPFFLGPSVAEIARHIRAVVSSVSIPVIVQYAPLQTGRLIEVPVFSALCSEHPNISHIKVDMVPSGPTISELKEQRVGSLAGYMGLHLPEDYQRGASGVMPTVSVVPAMVKIWQSLSSDMEFARQLHAHILPFLNFVMQSVEFLIACEKQLLADSGLLQSAFCRAPAYTLDATQRAELIRHRKRLDSLMIEN